MKILEVKNNLVKISYTAQDDLVISGFVIIEDSQYPYVAQVMSLKADGGMNYAIVKLLFTFNTEGVVKNYNGAIPELNANVTRLSADELLDILPVETPLKLGKLAQQKFVLNVDFSTLERNLLVCSDKIENTDILISNLVRQISDNNSKSIVFDTTGTIEAENKLVFGKDFKLPLNYDTINFIYEHDLNDVDPTSKAVLQDILLEVQEYSKTVLDKFVPFDTFINVVDSQYKQLKLPELALLKNRLIKYKDENAFAQEAKEIHKFRGAVRAEVSTIIDISSIDSDMQNIVLHTLYNELLDLDLFIYSFVKVDNDNTDKKLLKKFINQDKIYTTVVCGHNFKYLYELKEIASNMILFVPQTLQHDFNAYNVFLNKLNQDEYIVFGKSTQNIPLIIENLTLEDLSEYENEFNRENNPEDNKAADEQEQAVSDVSFSESEDSYSQESLIEDSVATEDLSDETAQEEVLEEEPLVPLEEYDESKENFEESSNANLTQYGEDSLEPIAEQTPDEFIELPEETQAETSLQPDELPQEEENTDTQLYDDIDEFNESEETEGLPDIVSETDDTSISDDINEEESISSELLEADNIEEEITENLTEDDLDFIDNINENKESQEEAISLDEMPVQSDNEQDFVDDNISISETEDNADEHFIEQASDEDRTPVVPIYPLEEETPVSGYQVEFEAGDRVSHPKYGEGVVEKMVKFGNKVLCAISFANGRRLLDPTISQIEKI